ncbi:ATP-binding protein [Spirochaetota bacterium]
MFNYKQKEIEQLQHVVDRAADIINVPFVLISLYNEKKKRFEFKIISSTKSRIINIATKAMQKFIPLFDPLAFSHAADVNPVIKNLTKYKKYHVSDLERVAENIVPKKAIKAVKVILKEKATALFPLFSQNKIVAAMAVSSQKDLSKHDIKVIQSFADQLSLLLENIELTAKSFESLLNRSPAIFVLWKAATDWPVEFISENISQFGYQAEDFLSGELSWLSIINPDDIKRLEKEYYSYIKKNKREFTIEYRIKTKTGGIRWIEARTFAIRNNKNKISHFQSIILDISDRIRMEEELKSTLEALKSSYTELRYKQQQLIQSGKLAALGELAAGIAHEINQPLTGISMGLGNILARLSVNNCSKPYIEEKCLTLQEYIKRIKYIIGHIKVFSREQTEKHYHYFDINLSVENALTLIHAQCLNYGINLKVHLSKKLTPVYGNVYQFEQIILNLLSNAREAIEMKEKAGTTGVFQKNITIRTYMEKKTKEKMKYVALEIRDNGIGFSKGAAQKIFEPFYTTKDPGKGTGLGLSITHTLVKNMSGDIIVKSVPNKFTSVIINIPQAKKQEALWPKKPQ